MRWGSGQNRGRDEGLCRFSHHEGRTGGLVHHYGAALFLSGLTGGGNLWNLLCKYRKGKGEWVGREGNGGEQIRRRPGKHDPVRPGETKWENETKKGYEKMDEKIPKRVKMACRCQPCGKKKNPPFIFISQKEKKELYKKGSYSYNEASGLVLGIWEGTCTKYLKSFL